MRDAADDLTLDPLDPLRGVALARETPPPLDEAVTAAAPTTCKRRRDAADLDPVAAAAGAMLAAALFQGCGLPLPPVAKRAYTKTAPRRGPSHTTYQKAVMAEFYEVNKLPDAKEQQALGEALGLSVRAVKVWFQNRRQRQKEAREGRELLAAAYLSCDLDLDLDLDLSCVEMWLSHDSRV